jgi:3-hydroxybutyryl-CoA dehydrogenase
MIRKVAVIGMGTIGKSIALTLAQTNCEVTIITRRGKEGFLDLSSYIEKEVEKHRTQKSKEEIHSKIAFCENYRKLPRDTELIIEAKEENLNEKQRIFESLDRIYAENVILSSTTSSLSISEISRFTSKPERTIGLHFFNPAHIMKLVEVVPRDKTSEETVKKVKIFLDEIGKTPVVVPDQPGFLVNRLLFSTINEAITVLGDGKISAEEIDIAIRLGLRHPMGPLHLADFVGLDVCLTTLENLYKRTKKTQYKPHPLLIQKVKRNDLGRKTGKGFFVYSTVTSREMKDLTK